MAELDRLNGQNGGTVPVVLTPNSDPEEARLESEEVSKYLLAKSYFDCREYDRCAAVLCPIMFPWVQFRPTHRLQPGSCKHPQATKKAKERLLRLRLFPTETEIFGI